MSLSHVIFRIRDRAFDYWNGIDTSGDVSLDRFTTVGGHRSEATYYGPSDPLVLRQALASLPIDHSRYSFVDLGSGKGRSVLIAAEWPFRHVIGVEFVKEFHEAALSNLRHWPARKIKCGGITLKHGDATIFELPSDPLVVFLFNPFNGTIMKQVMGKLTASVTARPRDIVVLYINPKQEQVILGIPGIEVIKKSKYYSLYRVLGA
jgi:SAM-dependent methyltransferase